jgi:gluconokinase
MILVIMGVTASGKSTVGSRAAEILGWPFYDADDFHPPGNVAKMSRGEPLTDADREPWLLALHTLMADHERQGRHAIVACSALKERYRKALREGLSTVQFVYLKGDPQVLQARLSHRKGHFMPPTMLPSQLAALEEPPDAITLNAECSPEDLANEIVGYVRDSGWGSPR